MTFETLRLERGDGIATCTFHRPDKKNALNETMVDELHGVLSELQRDDEARVLVLAGSPEVFVSGADIAELKERTRMDALRRINTALFLAIESFSKPTIAALRGYALGGGCELALACDLRVAGRSAKLGQPEVSLGILPGAGATYRLPRIVGQAFARELVFTGRIVDADEALSMGLVNRVVDDDKVLATARILAESIAKNSALALRLAKQSLNLAAELSTAGAMALESTAQAVLFEDQEKHRRMDAFLRKKKART